MADLQIAHRGGAGANRNGREFRSALEADQRARLAKVRFAFLQSLIGGRQLILKPIELRVTEYLPPLAAIDIVAGPCRRPGAGGAIIGGRCLLETVGHRDRGLLVFGPDLATRNQQPEACGKPGQKTHHAAPAGLPLFTRTGVPLMSESDGLRIT